MFPFQQMKQGLYDDMYRHQMGGYNPNSSLFNLARNYLK